MPRILVKLMDLLRRWSGFKSRYLHLFFLRLSLIFLPETRHTDSKTHLNYLQLFFPSQILSSV